MDYDNITIQDLNKHITENQKNIDETQFTKLILMCHIAKGLSDIGIILNQWRAFYERNNRR